MKRVIHLGPINSQGGMSTVIQNMANNTPEGYEAEVINTHSDGSLFEKIKIWIVARKILKKKIKLNQVDIVHIHATHSISWWRKISLMKICKKKSVPTIIHIHSGRFQEFCSNFWGITGLFVRRSLASKCKVVILEERWREILKKWIPGDAIIIPNSSEKKISRKNIIGKEIKILMLSRNSRGKGHDFALKILNSLQLKEVSAKLIMTGVNNEFIKNKEVLSVEARGWVSEDEKNRLITESDFLIMPSEFEGSSMSIIESMVNGLPCLVSPASSETVGIDQLVISLDDVEKWSDRIILLSKPNEYRKIIQLLDLKSEKYSIYNNMIKVSKLYDELTDKLYHGN